MAFDGDDVYVLLDDDVTELVDDDLVGILVRDDLTAGIREVAFEVLVFWCVGTGVAVVADVFDGCVEVFWRRDLKKRSFVWDTDDLSEDEAAVSEVTV